MDSAVKCVKFMVIPSNDLVNQSHPEYNEAR